MNKVTTITGLRQEGKTNELVACYIDTLDTLLVEPRTPHRVYFIKCALYDTDDDKNKIQQQFISEFQIDTDSIPVNKTIYTVNSIDLFWSYLTSFIKRSDCDVYIDDLPLLMEQPDFNGNSVNTQQELERFIDKYPNKDCGNSMDITYTRPRVIIDEDTHNDNNNSYPCMTINQDSSIVGR